MTSGWRVLADNWAWKLLSVALAVVLWIFVEGEPELVTVETVPVFYRNVEPTLALVARPPATVRLELRGSNDVLKRENLSNVALQLDLAGVNEPGPKVFQVERANVNLPAGVSFVRSDPPALTLHLDRAENAEQTRQDQSRQDQAK